MFKNIIKFILDNTIYRKYQIEYLKHIKKIFKNTPIYNGKNLILLENLNNCGCLKILTFYEIIIIKIIRNINII